MLLFLNSVACLWVAGLQCVPSAFVPGFPKLDWRARGCLSWWLFGGDKICLLTCKLRPAANESHSAAFVFASVPDLIPVQLHELLSRASPSVLEIKKCCNSWSFSFATPDTEIGCFTDQRSPLPSVRDGRSAKAPRRGRRRSAQC